MQAYKCHKVVLAAKVIGYHPETDRITTDTGWIIPRPSNTTTPGKELLGWYVVVYQDGYVSFSPAAVFEDGYTLLKP